MLSELKKKQIISNVYEFVTYISMHNRGPMKDNALDNVFVNEKYCLNIYSMQRAKYFFFV